MSNQIRHKVLQAVDRRRDEIVRFLQDLIHFPSVTGNESQIQDFISRYLTKMNLDVDKWELNVEELRRHPGYLPVETSYSNRPNVVGTCHGKGGGRSLLMNGHVDVIPVEPVADWSHDPWAGDVVDGRLYGRGASDMKSGLAAMTMALDTILTLGITLNADVIMEYTIDEELSGNGTVACILRGYRADAGICCETSSLHVEPASIGRIWFEISVRGKPAGIQRRWDGVNGIEKGYQIFEAINDYEQARVERLRHPLYPDSREALPCAVGVFNAGTYASAFPSSCLLKGSIATLPGENSDEVKQEFKNHITRVARNDPWMKEHPPQILWKGYFAEPAEIPADHPICTTMTRNYELVAGKKASVTGRMGAADIRHLIKYGNTPTVIFGPGLTSQMHATDEWVNIDDLILATKTIALSILEWCGYSI